LTLRPLLSWEGCEKLYIGSLPPPKALAEAALRAGEEYVALLESDGGFQHRSRFSIVGLDASDAMEAGSMATVYEDLSRFLGEAECSSLPCRDAAFLVVSYEAVGSAEPWLASKLGRHEWPLALAFRPERLVVYDHASDRAVVCPKGSAAVVGGRILRSFEVRGLAYRTPRENFEEWVRRAKEEIERGEAFQIVLSRVESLEYSGSLFEAYKRLARINPSPYMYYLSFPGSEIVGASPELLVKLDKGRLETHPIAGTRPRAEGLRDIELEEALLSDEKELAEHVMLVDLARNDLGSIAVPGTVEVTTYMDVEKYSHVQHIVSRVEALARPGLTFAEALKATLPAGTVSGAPKPRAMEIIAELEDLPRGPYAGAVGIAGREAGEAAIVIRSAWSLDGSIVELRAGAGIVYDSIPAREYMETEYKLKALKKALEGD
jgi:anthranilate synthase component 1